MKNIPQHLFFSGIGGSGVSALARFMADRGHIVAGSDRAFAGHPDHPALETLQAAGISLFPSDGTGITPDLDILIYSTAVEPDQPDLEKARQLGVRMVARPDYLAQIASGFQTTAVAGTSGKSTVSGMLAYLMKRLNLEPNFIGGGRVKQFRTAVNPGNSLTGNSDTLVIEACESDGSIVNYYPQRTILLNLDLDHHSVRETTSMFETLIQHTSGTTVINWDDRNLSSLHREQFASFSIERPSGYQAENIILQPLCSEFTVRNVRCRISLPGMYNIYNALACIACLAEMGIPLDAIAPVLPEFAGIERRFDIHRNDGRCLVIDDYAHNPHKIASMMRAMQAVKPAICYIFQPHGFGPTRMMKNEYISAFSEHLRPSDHLVLLPIYFAGGTAQHDISSDDLAKGVRATGKSAEAVIAREDVFEKAGVWNNFVVFGARDESLAKFADALAQKIPADEPAIAANRLYNHGKR
ncbi:MAG: UDP-N-acetylmuramate:L-alanine ligase [Nitrospirae bacterium]|nr:MAG: UDP-N-acetylmuramate:L-alanine ligase [Nitrospirota bacterium]